MGEIVAVCTSSKRGIRKTNVGSGMLVAEHGLQGDAHAGDWHRQVSLLALESIETMQQKGLEVQPGDFAENITTKGLNLVALPLGTRLQLGKQAVGEVTHIGKECHQHCEIYRQAGDCVMPREGIFIRILQGGPVQIGDPVVVMDVVQSN